jgi:hypothetical protein
VTLYYWRVHTLLPERYGQHCRMLVLGKLNSRLIEFMSDGYKVITSGNYIRRVK